MHLALLADPHLSLDRADADGRLFTDSRWILDRVVDQVNRGGYDQVVWLGDLTHGGSPQDRQAFAESTARLSVPSLRLVGNHDVDIPTKDTFHETVPIVRHALLAWAGWTVAVVDSVLEQRPDHPDGHFSDTSLGLLRDAVQRAGGGPLLVLTHHPPREPYTNAAAFFDAVAGHRGVGVCIAGHTHRNRDEVHTGPPGPPGPKIWHCLERSSLVMHPLEYHRLTLTPQELAIEPVRPDLGPLHDKARRAVLECGGQEKVDTLFGTRASRNVSISVTPPRP